MRYVATPIYIAAINYRSSVLALCWHAVPDYPRVTRIGLSEEQKRTHARKLNLIRRHLNTEQKRVVIKAQLKETPGISDRQIAAGLGVSQPTVSTVRKEMVEAGDVIKFITSTDTLGREQPRQRTTPVDDTIPTGNDYNDIDGYDDADDGDLSIWEQSIVSHYEALPQHDTPVAQPEAPSGLQGAARALHTLLSHTKYVR